MKDELMQTKKLTKAVDFSDYQKLARYMSFIKRNILTPTLEEDLTPENKMVLAKNIDTIITKLEKQNENMVAFELDKEKNLPPIPAANREELVGLMRQTAEKLDLLLEQQTNAKLSTLSSLFGTITKQNIAYAVGGALAATSVIYSARRWLR